MKTPETQKKNREKYIDDLTAKLKEWDHDLAEMEEKFNQRKADLKTSYQRKAEELKGRRKEIENKLHSLKTTGGETYDRAKKEMERLWDDLKTGLKSVREELAAKTKKEPKKKT